MYEVATLEEVRKQIRQEITARKTEVEKILQAKVAEGSVADDDSVRIKSYILGMHNFAFGASRNTGGRSEYGKLLLTSEEILQIDKSIIYADFVNGFKMIRCHHTTRRHRDKLTRPPIKDRAFRLYKQIFRGELSRIGSSTSRSVGPSLGIGEVVFCLESPAVKVVETKQQKWGRAGWQQLAVFPGGLMKFTFFRENVVPDVVEHDPASLEPPSKQRAVEALPEDAGSDAKSPERSGDDYSIMSCSSGHS